MELTTFSRKLWKLESFEQIGYDRLTETLIIFFLDGRVQEFLHVKENVVFQFVIALNKEQFLLKQLIPHYSFFLYAAKIPSNI
ncbi:hypothetical protein N781_10955 [Pontibacillus halophilus JSM 076056 = DSM 19796]|uniref:KTSC domain-containing protein n=1 Tax=Pontibacillus halophilus JSM 076056 = DSM 19796 TaxID=1385510 RepID=A0A0A5GK31_9BACI|nr:KTSC domain-containing protein [Pontibacillus halophilus]KGX93636.1 hypothetical protein N781_10955 [Pontibacillus halophilus JSM 076056 = DSM 19796]